MSERPPPRIYCIPAMNAPVVAVFRRGPTHWSHVGRWDLARRVYEPGAWLGARIFPRRSDLSPDGRFLCYFAHKPGADWEHGEAYVALSKLPWVTALHAFGTCGTWTRGYHFIARKRADDTELAALPIPYGLESTPVVQFALERMRGWSEAPDSPPRGPNDAWDERRLARMVKPQPRGRRVLNLETVQWVTGRAEQTEGPYVDGQRVAYSLEGDGDLTVLDRVQWADWDTNGHLLLATHDGRLQEWDLSTPEGKRLFEADLSLLEPKPEAAPAWAQRW